jgi:hypothetical protein
MCRGQTFTAASLHLTSAYVVKPGQGMILREQLKQK